MRAFAALAVVVIVGCFVWSSEARAQAAQPSVSARPSPLSLSATRGDQLVREITVSGDAAALDGPWTVERVPLSTPQGEQQDVDALSAKERAQGTNRSVEVTVNLDKTKPGTYAGEVTVRGKAGVLVRVPVTVNVKSGQLLPIILLLVGIFVGFWLSWYRGNRMERDDVLGKIGALRQRITSDVAPAFVVAIERRLVAARDELSRKDYTKATEEVAKAEGLLMSFRAQPGEWLQQLKFADDLVAAIQGLSATGTTTHRDGLLAATRALVDKAPSGDVAAFAKDLIEVRRRAQRYIRIDRKLRALEENIKHKKAIQTWRDTIDTSAIDDDAKLDGVEKEIDATAEADGAAADLDRSGGQKLPAAPKVHAAEIAEGARARNRVAIAGRVALGIGLVGLAALGYHELYETKPTFGGFWAHVTLLFWGLGAEVTRGSAAAFLKQGGIPDAK